MLLAEADKALPHRPRASLSGPQHNDRVALQRDYSRPNMGYVCNRVARGGSQRLRTSPASGLAPEISASLAKSPDAGGQERICFWRMTMIHNQRHKSPAVRLQAFELSERQLRQRGGPRRPAGVCMSFSEIWPALAAVGSGCAGHRRKGRQGNDRAEDVVGIVKPLGFDEPLRVATIASGHAIRIVVAGEEVRISAGKRDRVEGVARGPRPQPMPLLLDLVRESANLAIISTSTWSRRRPKAVASSGTRAAAPLNSWVKTAQPGEAAVSVALMIASTPRLSSAGKPAGLHQISLAIDEELVEHGRARSRRASSPRCSASGVPSRENRQLRFALLRRGRTRSER